MVAEAVRDAQVSTVHEPDEVGQRRLGVARKEAAERECTAVEQAFHAILPEEERRGWVVLQHPEMMR